MVETKFWIILFWVLKSGQHWSHLIAPTYAITFIVGHSQMPWTSRASQTHNILGVIQQHPADTTDHLLKTSWRSGLLQQETKGCQLWTTWVTGIPAEACVILNALKGSFCCEYIIFKAVLVWNICCIWYCVWANYPVNTGKTQDHDQAPSLCPPNTKEL